MIMFVILLLGLTTSHIISANELLHFISKSSISKHESVVTDAILHTLQTPHTHHVFDKSASFALAGLNYFMLHADWTPSRLDSSWDRQERILRSLSPLAELRNGHIQVSYESTQTIYDFLAEWIEKGMIHVLDLEKTAEKLIMLFSEGIEFVVTDFDGTLSRYKLENGERGMNSNKVLVQNLLKHRQIIHERLYSYFHQFETMLDISDDELAKKYVTWYKKVEELLIRERITKSDISKFVDATPPTFREGAQDWIRLIAKAQVPLLTFSAGQGQVIRETYMKNGLLFPNMEIVSNEMIFDKEDQLIGFAKMIHPLNKNAQDCDELSENLKQAILKEKNHVLFGDLPADLKMTRNSDNRLSIGILNNVNTANMAAYGQIYDIVILGDDFSFPLALFKLFF